MAVKELFQWGELFKFPVRPLQDGFIGIIQPVALTFGYGIQSLCIELAVVDGDICIDGAGDLNADETAAVYDGFSRMAVPLFMIVSAYLLVPMKEAYRRISRMVLP